MTQPCLFLFKNWPDIRLVARHILSYNHRRVYMSEQLEISSNFYPPLQTRHTSIQPTVPLQDYQETVISYILHEENHVCILLVFS